MDTKLWYLKQMDIFAELPAEKMEAISKTMGSKNVGKREIILEPDNKDKVFFLKSGELELYQLTADGKKTILDRLGPGSIFGDLGSDHENDSFAQATSDAFVCTLTKEQFFDIISKNPDLSVKLMRFFLDRLKQAETAIGSLASDNLVFKFASLLRRLSLNHGTENETKIQIKEKFTHEELASMLGTSRQTMTKLINALEKERVVQRKERKITFDKTVFEKKYG